MKSAKVDVKPTFDIKFEQRALNSRLEFKPRLDQSDGLHDRNEHDEDDDRNLKQYLEDESERESFEKYLAPDKGTPDFATPKAALAAQVVKVKRRVPKAELPKKRTLLELAKTIRETDDRATKGEALIEAKRTLDRHGEWLAWLAKRRL